MKTPSKITALALLGTLAASALSPALADPASQQKNKNQWRNLGILGAAVAGYGLLKHDQNATILGAAGGAYSANRYEQDRRHQSQDNANRQRYYYGGSGNYNNGYGNGNGYGYPTNGYGNGRTYGNGGNGGYYDGNGNYHNGGYNNGGYNSGYGNGGYDGQTYQSFSRRHDNGKHKGWFKKHGGENDDRHGDDNGEGD